MDPIRFDPPDRPRGVIQWVYGFGEHAGMYTPLAHYFNRHGYAFVINDLPGHGAMADLSPAQRRKRLGVVASYDDFLDDIWTIRSLIGQWHPNLPVILAGLSMGGGIVLNFVEKYVDAPYAKVMVESPWLELAKPMPGIVTRFARLVGKITPNMAIPSGLDLDAITRDPAVTAQTKADPLFHTRISLRLYAAVYDAGQYTIAHANAITLPTLVMLGTNDRIISTEAIRRLAANAGMNLTLQEFAGAYHCLHNETNAAEVRQKMLDFIA